MSKSKNQAGVHLYKKTNSTFISGKKVKRPYWYWHLRAKNGRLIIRSTEMYKSKQGAIKSIMATAKHFDANQHYYDQTDKKNIPHLVAYNI